MDWIWLILYMGIIYALGYWLIFLIQIRNNLIWYWFIISWIIWFIISIIYRELILTPDYLSPEISNLKFFIDHLWLCSLFFPLQHILLIISIVALIIKKWKK